MVQLTACCAVRPGQIKPAASPPNPGHGGFIEWSRTAELLDALELLRFSDARDGGDGGYGAAVPISRVFLETFIECTVKLWLRWDLQSNKHVLHVCLSVCLSVWMYVCHWSIVIGQRRSWTPDFHEELQAWWVKFEEYVVSKYAAGERSMTNNHGSW